MKSLLVDEGVGVANDTVFIEIQGMAEPALEITVQLSTPSEPASDSCVLGIYYPLQLTLSKS